MGQARLLFGEKSHFYVSRSLEVDLKTHIGGVTACSEHILSPENT
jgi:hypothetical protein